MTVLQIHDRHVNVSISVLDELNEIKDNRQMKQKQGAEMFILERTFTGTSLIHEDRLWNSSLVDRWLRVGYDLSLEYI